MYGDTARIRALADALRERADDIRGLADRLATSAARVPWEGLAADAMRHQASARAAALRRTALLHDDAAEALDRHAGRVDHVKDVVESVVSPVLHVVGIG